MGVMTGDEHSDAAPARVLVVEDDRSIRLLLQLQLTARDLQVFTAATGEEAVERLRVERFGCLLIDKSLPGMDGFEVIRRARKLQPCCRCIMITAQSTQEAAIDALRAGAIDYVEKPFVDLDLIFEKVRNALEQERLAVEHDLMVQRLGAYEARLEATEKRMRWLQSEAENGLQLREKLHDRISDLIELAQELAEAHDDERLSLFEIMLIELLTAMGEPEG